MQTDLAAIRERLARAWTATCPFEAAPLFPSQCRICGKPEAHHFYARDVAALLAELEGKDG